MACSHPVANTILAQLGGGRFLGMTGVKNLVGDETSLWFHLPRCKGGVNRFSVTLDASDTYTVEAGKWDGKAMEIVRVEAAEGVYSEDLRRVFTDMTGLDTAL